MIDMDKVIKGLECHRIDDNHRINCADCPYYVDSDNYIQCENDLHDDAVFLLKEQPERKTAHWVFGNTMGHSWMKCSECCVSQSGQTGCWTYCPNCGAEMKGETKVEID